MNDRCNIAEKDVPQDIKYKFLDFIYKNEFICNGTGVLPKPEGKMEDPIKNTTESQNVIFDKYFLDKTNVFDMDLSPNTQSNFMEYIYKKHLIGDVLAIQKKGEEWINLTDYARVG